MMLESTFRLKVEFPINDAIIHNKEVTEIWMPKWQRVALKHVLYFDVFLGGRYSSGKI